MKKGVFVILLCAIAALIPLSVCAQAETPSERTITGTIHVPEDFEGSALLWVRGDDLRSSEISINAPGDYPYSIALGDYLSGDPDEEVFVSLSFGNDARYVCNYYTGKDYYYDWVKLDGEGASGIDFTLKKAKTIYGTLSFGEGAYITEGDLKITVSLESFSIWERRLLELDTAAPVEYCIGVPIDCEDEEFELCLDVYSADCDSNIYQGDYSYTGKELLELHGDIYWFNIGPDGKKMDLTVPAPYAVHGEIVLPEDAIGKVEHLIVNYEYQLMGGYHSGGSAEPMLDENGRFTVYLPPEENNYSFSIYPKMSDISNVFERSCYYVSDEESSYSRPPAAPVHLDGLSAPTLRFHLNTGIPVSGKIVTPKGVEIPSGTEAVVYVNKGSAADGGKKLVTLTGRETEFMLPIPKSAKWAKISYSTDSFDGIYNHTVYLNESLKPTLDEGDGLWIEVNGGISGLVLPLVRQRGGIELVTHRPVYAGRNYSLEPYIEVVFDNGEIMHMHADINAYEDSGGTSLIELPELEEYADITSFKVRYSINEYGKDDNLAYDYENMYINRDGSFTFDEDDASSWPLDSNGRIDFVFRDNSALLSGAPDGSFEARITSAGIVDSSVRVKISYSNDPELHTYYNAAVIICEYDAEGALVGLYHRFCRFEHVADGELTVDLPVDYDPDNTYKVLLWDNPQYMHPLSGAKPAI